MDLIIIKNRDGYVCSRDEDAERHQMVHVGTIKGIFGEHLCLEDEGAPRAMYGETIEGVVGGYLLRGYLSDEVYQSIGRHVLLNPEETSIGCLLNGDSYTLSHTHEEQEKYPSLRIKPRSNEREDKQEE